MSGQYALLMAETKEEAQKWVIALTELRNLFLRSALPRKDIYMCRELCDATNIPMLRTAQCAVQIEFNKAVIGFSDHGLMFVEFDNEVYQSIKLR